MAGLRLRGSYASVGGAVEPSSEVGMDEEPQEYHSEWEMGRHPTGTLWDAPGSRPPV